MIKCSMKMVNSSDVTVPMMTVTIMPLEFVITLLLDLIFVKMGKSKIQEASVKLRTNSALPRKRENQKPEARNQDGQEILGNIYKADIVFNDCVMLNVYQFYSKHLWYKRVLRIPFHYSYFSKNKKLKSSHQTRLNKGVKTGKAYCSLIKQIIQIYDSLMTLWHHCCLDFSNSMMFGVVHNLSWQVFGFFWPSAPQKSTFLD